MTDAQNLYELEILGELQVQCAREWCFHPPRSEKQRYCSDECWHTDAGRVYSQSVGIAEDAASAVLAAPGVQHRPQVTVQCEEDGTL